jgi:hypothetical protein
MVGKTELERLHLQKELLALQCDADRHMLAVEWQQLHSRDYWLAEAGKMARRHPLWTTALAAGAGVLVTQAVRKPGAATGWLRRLVRMASTASSLWRLFDGKEPRE